MIDMTFIVTAAFFLLIGILCGILLAAHSAYQEGLEDGIRKMILHFISILDNKEINDEDLHSILDSLERISDNLKEHKTNWL